MDKLEKSNVVYEYDCICQEFYIGETKRALDIRIRDHQTKSRNTNIYQHIEKCSCFQKSAEEFANENIENFTSKPKAIYAFFASLFKIISKGHRSCRDREKVEAFYIRVRRPTLNNKFDHKSFQLYGSAL